MKSYMKRLFLSLLLMATMTLAGCLPQTPFTVKPTNQNQPVTDSSTGGTTEVVNTNKLDLSNQGLTKVSQNIFSMTNLQELNVSYNRLTGALPAEIRHLQKLEVLDASNNQMTGVPAEIGQLKNLRILDLSNNQLTGLPYELANLKNLETLNLSGNNYSTQDLEIIRQGLPADVNLIL